MVNKKSKQILWKETPQFRLNHSDFNKKVEWLEENGNHLYDVEGKKTIASRWFVGDWCVDEKEGIITIYAREPQKGFIRYTTDTREEKNYREGDTVQAGYNSFKIIYNCLTNKYGVGLKAAFGSWGKDFMLDKCAMGIQQLISIPTKKTHRILHGCYKADFSSAFPAAACGRLPDRHGYQMRLGYVEPNEEYPFAFYVNSGHSAEYKGYDTRTWGKRKWYADRGKFERVLPRQEITVLMKASKYELTDVLKDLYKKKSSGDEDMKTFLVAFFGYLRSTKSFQNNYMAHISIVAYGRHVQKMMDYADKLEEDGNEILMFATDSIAWKGKKSSLTTEKTEKVLGSFVNEYEDADMAIVACGVYAIQEKGKLYLVKHQGTDGDTIEKANIRNLSDFIDFYVDRGFLIEDDTYNKETNKFEKRRIAL